MKMVVKMTAISLYTYDVSFSGISILSTTLLLGGHISHKSQLPLLFVSAINMKQFLWDCTLMLSNNKFPVPFKALIDTGAAVDLIHKHLVTSLALPYFSISFQFVQLQIPVNC